MPRCGSLDSLRDGPHVPHDDGKLELVGGGAGVCVVHLAQSISTVM